MVFFQRLATLYVRYVQIFRQLEEAYDQVVHPQKRKVIREVLDGVMGRVLELKNEMVEKEFSEYHYMDDVIQDMKLTPVSSPPPPSFLIMKVDKKTEHDKSPTTGVLKLGVAKMFLGVASVNGTNTYFSYIF